MLSDIQRIKLSIDSGFSDALLLDEIECLKTITRITIEVSDYLIYGRFNVPAGNDLRYNLETVISGVDSFVVAINAFNSREDTTDSKLNWDELSQETLLAAIRSTYENVLSESDLNLLVRDIFDLFKLQLALVAISY